jgi:apolipoprotein N-acyltransferase
VLLRLSPARWARMAGYFHLATPNHFEAPSQKLRSLAYVSQPREPPLNNYAFAAAIGLFLGIAIVWWVRPDTNAGTAFIVVASTVFCFILGVVLTFVGKLFASGKRRPTGGGDDIT